MKKRCFVVMPFQGMEEVYKRLYKPACDEIGITCKRVNDSDYKRPGFIPKDIISEITSADVIIVDVTLPNPNVYYELGYAHSSGDEKVIITRLDSNDKIPFDISNYRILNYKDGISGLTEAKTDLIEYINNAINQQDSPFKCVRAFYSYISEKRYEHAWDYLTLEYQNRRWVGDIQSFIDGYRFIYSISDVKITHLSEGQGVSKFLVSYLEESDSPVYEEIRNIGQRTVGFLPKLIDNISELKKRLTSKGFKGSTIDELTLWQLIRPNRGTTLSWLLKKESGLEIDDFFSAKNVVKMSISVEVYVAYREADWFISRIKYVEAG